MERQSALTPALRELLAYSQLQYLLDIVADEPECAQIYSDSSSAPSNCILLYHEYIWLAGKINKPVIREVARRIYSSGRETTIAMIDGEKPYDVLMTEFKRTYFNARLLFIKDDMDADAADGAGVVPISRALMRSKTGNLEMIENAVAESGAYRDMSDFFGKGFGFVTVVDGKVAAYCISKDLGKASVAIGANVAEGHRHKGLAIGMINEFVREARARSLDVYWDMWSRNEPEIKTALACGFSKVAEYPVLLIDTRGERWRI